LVAEDARKNGIPVVGITWGTFTSKPLLLITQDNTISLNISSKTLLSKNPTTYESVTNTFIMKITEALLRHTMKTGKMKRVYDRTQKNAPSSEDARMEKSCSHHHED
jgi:hypothetical protein